jgi:exodeoxyribonuclease VII large subunit
MEQQAISLRELNEQVSNVVQTTFDTAVWITAEVSEARVAANGHCYLEFIEKSDRTQNVVARARAVIWSNRWWLLGEAFRQATGQALSPGMKIMVQVRVTMHAAYGYCLDVQDLDPNYTLGEMARRRMEILNRLTEEGIMEMNRELPLPRLTQRLAVISAAGAAGYGDFCHQLEHNEGGFHFYTHLFPAAMQGTRTEPEIIAALERIYQHAELFDAVVIIRGGGATADLASFDSYELAANCAQFPLPILVGIGHERDSTVLDAVAHTSLKTPTAVASFLIERMNDEAALVQQLQAELLERVQEIRRHEQERLRMASLRLQQTRLTLQQQLNRLAMIRERMTLTLRQRTTQEQQKLKFIAQSVQWADPAYILRRGFSITRLNGHAVIDPSEIKKGDRVITQVAQGSFESVITDAEISPRKEF